ncbi:MAG: TetR/AcrR family transcriptional regulator [Solimonas sp.]
MKISKEQVAENRERILGAASELFRERGFGGVTVAEIMNAAGLTHGAFYGHFGSKDDLITQASSYTLARANYPEGQEPALPVYAAGYLSEQRRDRPDMACAFAALGSEVARASDETRHAFTESVERQIVMFSKSAAGKTAAERRRNAIVAWSAMLGAMTLARMVNDPALSDELLRETRKALGAEGATEKKH